MNLKKILILLLAIIMVLTLAACSGKNKSDDEPVAKVGEMTITDGNLNQYMYLYCFMQNIDLSKIGEEEREYIKSLILEDYISLNLIRLEYLDNTEILPEDFEDAVEEFVSNVAEQEQAAAYMKKYSISDEFLREFYKDQYYSMEFFNKITADIPESDEEDARTYYDEHQNEFEIDEVTANHILVEDESLAKEILQQLKDGDDFEALAKEYSIDGTAENGGSLGSFGRGAMVQEFEEAAFALKSGEISDLVKTIHGYHIIKVTEKKQGQEDFEDVKDLIIENLNRINVNEAYRTEIEKLREKHGIEYLNE